MLPWSTSLKLWLASAFCVVFAAVLMFGGPGDLEETGRAAPAVPSAQAEQRQSAMSRAPITSIHESSEASNPLPPPKTDEADPWFPDPDPAPVAQLARDVMPADETTAEENEQRGDAIRRLGSSTAPEAVAALIHVLRNDSDVRNRILAIDGLRRAALAGSSDRGISNALNEAARMDDEVIASQAQQALNEIHAAAPGR